MDQNQIMLLLSVILFFLLIINEIKKRPGILLAFFGRGISGLLFIHFFNLFCLSRDIVTHVSVNGATALFSCCLGVPGALLAYGIRLWGLR
ncbi:MAG: pro-sigmaK processing inhibitor BofA family protein [Eubacterium sp.]|nr:pro-sigmaK processing inhibitor BofA family protein [Eubacterium sp.]